MEKKAPITDTEINHMIGESMVDGGDYLMRFAHNLIDKCHDYYTKDCLDEETVKNLLLHPLPKIHTWGGLCMIACHHSPSERKWETCEHSESCHKELIKALTSHPTDLIKEAEGKAYELGFSDGQAEIAREKERARAKTAMIKTYDDMVQCPEKNCSQIGCRHRSPHRRKDNCSEIARGNILNGCRVPCQPLERDYKREAHYPLGVSPMYKFNEVE